MKNVVSLFLLVSSSSPACVPHSATSQSAISAFCVHDNPLDSPATAWPGALCDADSHALSHFDTPPPYPLSCPPHPQNRACFPIWEPKNKAPAFREAESQALLDEPKIKFRSAKPHLSPRPEQRVTHDTRGPWGTTGYQARSILMTWPKGVSHAILYTDLACKHVGSGLAEEAWHVRKTGRQSKQFESLRAGMFGSVEFLTHKEWKLRAWKRRGAEIVKGLEV